MGNKYVVTAQGFFKEIMFNKAELKSYLVFTDKLREAKSMNGSSAKKLMEKYELIGFIYNPYAEEPGEKRYTVEQVHSYEKKVYYWVVTRVWSTVLSDVGFLINSKREEKTYSEEEAKALAAEKNKQMIDDITNLTCSI